MKRIGLLSLAVATAVTMACNGNARTDNTANDATVGTSGVAERNNGSAADRDFVQKMMADGNAEVQLGKMAQQRAASADVKAFGAMMVRDHTKAGEELKKIAAEYDIQAPAKIDDKHQDLMDKLSKLNGRDFDREYINAMVDDHQDAIGDLKKHVDVDNSTRGTTGAKEHSAVDQNVKPEKASDHVEYSINQWSAMTLPTVEHHLDNAKQIQDKLQNNKRTAAARHTAPHIAAAHKAKS
jgi:putative membrane protein